MTLLDKSIWTVLLEKLFKIMRAQEARHNQFFFKNIQNNEIFEIFKMFKSNSAEFKFTKQKAKGCSPWIACSLFDWKYLFLGKFGKKTQSYQFKLKLCT